MRASRITFSAVLVLLGAIAVAPAQSTLVADLADPLITSRVAASLDVPASVTPVAPSATGSDRHLENLAVAAAEIDLSPVAVDHASEVAAPGNGLGIPGRAVTAYQRAARVLDAVAPDCALPWTLLAGIGRVESDHGRHGGSTVAADGLVTPDIVGVALDGTGPVARIPDTDGGTLDGDRRWDRAVGPMQFIPSTWQVTGVDGDGDGERSPHDLDDAALAAGVYLCAGGTALDNPAGTRAALLRYNADSDYARLVQAYARSYARGDFGTEATAAALAVQPLPTLSPLTVLQAGPALPAKVRRTTDGRTTARPAATPAAAASSPRDNPTPATLTRSPRPSPTGTSSTPRDPADPKVTSGPTGSPSTSPDSQPTGSPSSSDSPSPSGPPSSSGSPSPSGSQDPSPSQEPKPSGSSSPSGSPSPSTESNDPTPSTSDPAGPNPSAPEPGPDPAGSDPAGSGSSTPTPQTTTRSGTWSSCGEGFCLDGAAILVGTAGVLASTARADHDGDGTVETNRAELSGLAQGPQPVQVTLRDSPDGPVLTSVGGHAYGG